MSNKTVLERRLKSIEKYDRNRNDHDAFSQRFMSHSRPSRGCSIQFISKVKIDSTKLKLRVPQRRGL